MCSPAEYVSMTRERIDGNGADRERVAGDPRDRHQSRLAFRIAGHLVNTFGEREICTYPTPCKGRYRDTESGRLYYPFQSPHSLNVLPLLPQLRDAGVDALKIEGRQRSHVYVREVARVFRDAIDELEATGTLAPRRRHAWEQRLELLFEGRRLTTACYGEK